MTVLVAWVAVFAALTEVGLRTRSWPRRCAGLVCLCPVTTVHVARRKNPALYIAAIVACGSLLSTFAFKTASSVLFGGLGFGAVVLIVTALLMRGYTGERKPVVSR